MHGDGMEVWRRLGRDFSYETKCITYFPGLPCRLCVLYILAGITLMYEDYHPDTVKRNEESSMENLTNRDSFQLTLQLQ